MKMRRKIIVTGCFNCPYLTVWNDGSENGTDSIVSGTCGHPSVNNQLEPPNFTSDVFLYYGQTSEKVTGIKAGFYPACPLPSDE